jgi:hypothetical protein
MTTLSIWHSFVLLILSLIYLTPSAVAYRRNHQNVMAIVALNFLSGCIFVFLVLDLIYLASSVVTIDLLAGLTVIGWVGALVWSLTAVRTASRLD